MAIPKESFLIGGGGIVGDLVDALNDGSGIVTEV
jgi:hypothetical protein